MNTAQQQQQQQKSMQASRVASLPAVVAKSSSSSSDKDEILLVLGHVKALQQTNQQGINREIPSSASAVHEEVIALLMHLAQNQTPPQETSVVLIGTKHETQNVFEDDNEELTFHKKTTVFRQGPGSRARRTAPTPNPPEEAPDGGYFRGQEKKKGPFRAEGFISIINW